MASAVASTEDGGRARTRAAFSRGSDRCRSRGTRGPSGRGAATGEAGARRSRAGEGAVPRRAWHALGGGPAAGHPVRGSHAAPDASLCDGRRTGARRGHRRDNGHVHRHRQRSLEAALVSGAGPAPHVARSHGKARRVLGILESRSRRRQARESLASDRSVDLWRRHRQRPGRATVRGRPSDLSGAVLNTGDTCLAWAHVPAGRRPAGRCRCRHHQLWLVAAPLRRGIGRNRPAACVRRKAVHHRGHRAGTLRSGG